MIESGGDARDFVTGTVKRAAAPNSSGGSRTEPE
jgi:hypothetical protein